MPIEPRAQRWYDFACDPQGRIGVRAGNESIVDVVDLRSGASVRRFETNVSPSGRLALSADGTRCLTGGWANPNGGVCCYSIEDGTMLWRRRDMNRPQAVLRDDRNDGWVVSLDRGGTHLLDGRSGKTIGKIRGAGFGSRVTFIPERQSYLCVFKKRMELLTSQSLSPMLRFKVPAIWNHFEPDARVPTGFAIAHSSLQSTTAMPSKRCDRVGALCAAHGNGQLVISISCGPLLAFSLETGELAWSVESPTGSHHLRVGVSSDRNRCYALQWSRIHGGSEELLEIELNSGSVLNQHVIPAGGWSSGRFVRDATAIISGSGELDLATRHIREFN